MIWSVRDRFFGEVTFACIDQHFFGGADFFQELDADELFLFGGGAVSRVMLFLKKNITVVETREDRLMLGMAITSRSVANFPGLGSRRRPSRGDSQAVGGV